MNEDDERSQLVPNREFDPVDYGGPANEAKRHRRQLCVTAVVVCCVGVGLCLAIALPLTVGRSQSTEASAATGGGSVNALLQGARMVLMQRVPDADSSAVNASRWLAEEDDDGWPAGNNATGKTPHTATTTTEYPERRTRRRFTFPPYITPTTTTTTTTTSSASAATTVTTTGNSTASSATTEAATTATPPPWILPMCPQVPASRRGVVDMSLVNGTTWYELHRVQTFNSPAFVADVSCASMKLDVDPEPATEAVMKLSWEDGVFFNRIKRHKSLELRRNDTKSPSWIEWFNTSSAKTDYAQISFLSMINNYLLVFECFPSASFYPVPGYVIRVYSSSRIPDFSRMDEALLLAAQVWGLNSADRYPIRIRQRFCDRNIGYA